MGMPRGPAISARHRPPGTVTGVYRKILWLGVALTAASATTGAALIIVHAATG